MTAFAPRIPRSRFGTRVVSTSGTRSSSSSGGAAVALRFEFFVVVVVVVDDNFEPIPAGRGSGRERLFTSHLSALNRLFSHFFAANGKRAFCSSDAALS